MNLPIGWLLRAALQKPDYQIIGAPGWIDTDRCTIMAKAPDGTPQPALATLMLNLLKDRFQLATHLETRELLTFNLVMARTDGRPARTSRRRPPIARRPSQNGTPRSRRLPPDVAPRRRFQACQVDRRFLDSSRVRRRRAALAVSSPAMWPPAVGPWRSSYDAVGLGRPPRDRQDGIDRPLRLHAQVCPEGVRAGARWDQR